MPKPSLSRDEVIERVVAVFRQYGYDGASLSRLSEATGLGKSSLYHYFPKGKEDMAAAAFDYAGAWFGDAALAPLTGPGGPRERLLGFVAGLREFYAEGKVSCLFNLFGIGDARDLFEAGLRLRVTRLVQALSTVATEVGIGPAEAARRAEDAMISLHGALVISRAVGSTDPFDRVMAELPDRLLTTTH